MLNVRAHLQWKINLNNRNAFAPNLHPGCQKFLSGCSVLGWFFGFSVFWPAIEEHLTLSVVDLFVQPVSSLWAKWETFFKKNFQGLALRRSGVEAVSRYLPGHPSDLLSRWCRAPTPGVLMWCTRAAWRFPGWSVWKKELCCKKAVKTCYLWKKAKAEGTSLPYRRKKAFKGLPVKIPCFRKEQIRNPLASTLFKTFKWKVPHKPNLLG